MKILYIHHHNPLPVRSGMDKFTYNLLRSLRQIANITLVFPCEETPENDHIKDLESICEQVIPCELTPKERKNRTSGLGKFKNLFKTYVLAEPFHCSRYYFPNVADKLQDLTYHNNFDLIQASSIYTEKYLRKYMGNICTVLGPIDDVLKPIEKNAGFKERIIWYFSRRARKKQEKGFLRNVDFITYISGPDAKNVMKRTKSFSQKIYHCPVYSELPLDDEIKSEIQSAIDKPDKFIIPNKIVFMGNFAAQRIQLAVDFLISQIFPEILLKNPDTILYIVGKNPTREIIAAGKHKNIEVTGEVSDHELIRHLLSAAVFVAPSRTGTGIKTKTLHAMSLGKAIVATSKEVSGFEVLNSDSLSIEDHPKSFANKVNYLLEHPKDRIILGQNAYKLYMENYSENVLNKRIIDLYRFFFNQT